MPGMRELWLGNYDYVPLCKPYIPFLTKPGTMQQFGPDEKMPILVAALMGLQHAFAMVGGLITPPLVVSKFAVDGWPWAETDWHQYAVSAALICSGIFTIFNVMQVQLPNPFSQGAKIVLGTGVVSVMGTSFTFLPIFERSIAMMKADGMYGREAYGNMLGTVMICSLVEIFLSFVPTEKLKRAFPPLVQGITVMLIGIALTGTGMKYWGGGVVCAEYNGFSFLEQCSGNGEVKLPYGSAEYIGLGFSVMVMLVFIEIFGSPFMKNCNVVIGLLFGYMIAGATRVYNEENDDEFGDKYLDYVTPDKIEDAPAITFLWVQTFPLGVYGPAFLPCIIAYIITTIETIGDIGATFEASGLETGTERHETALHGGLRADGFSSLFAALFTSMPNTTFSQNNGVIAMTKCGSKYSGYACGCWLIFFGVIGKVAGVITSIPDCVLGGMTIFLFCNVFVSGLKIISHVDFNNRKNRFILALSLAIGIGVTVWPYAFLDRRNTPYTANFFIGAKLDCSESCSAFKKGLRDSLSIFLSTGYCIGPVIAMFLNAILPEDVPEDVPPPAKATATLVPTKEAPTSEPVTTEMVVTKTEDPEDPQASCAGNSL